MTFEVGRGEKAGPLRRLHAPASGRLEDSARHIGRTCLGPAAARPGQVITGSGNNRQDGTGWTSR